MTQHARSSTSVSGSTSGPSGSSSRSTSSSRSRPSRRRSSSNSTSPRQNQNSGRGSTQTDSAFKPAVETTPYVAVDSFAELGLPDALVSRLRHEGIIKPFPIQAATIADALTGVDVLGRAQTGAGKTLAFGLPMLARLAGRKATPRQPLALVLVPTRELAMQVTDALEPLAHAVGLRIQLVAGGLPIGKQMSALVRGTQIVVATPGRLTDLVERGACRLNGIEVLVLDEADRMADMGFLPVVSRFLDDCPRDGQRLLFSATLDGDVDVLVRRYLRSPVTRSIAPDTASMTTMEHHVLHVSADDKLDVTAHVAAREGRSLLFVRTKHGADRLAKSLRARGVPAASLHGGMTQGARTKALERFRDGSVPALVATDVAARGIHVDDVGLVLHVDPPADPKDYLHRSGRTARAGGSGTVVVLVLPQQRHEVDALTRAAGVDAVRHVVSRSTNVLAGITGARTPSGVPLTEMRAEVRRTAARPGTPGGRRPTRSASEFSASGGGSRRPNGRRSRSAA